MSASGGPLTSRSPVVLLIDDEPDIRNVWAMMLEMEGLTASTAANGREGLEKAHELRPDVVICDFMMPGLNGLEVCRQLREDEALKNIAVILWSAVRGIDADGSADLVVEKPVHIEAFLEDIKSLASRSSGK
ncbi:MULTISPECIES: response regulator transcription factor [unclassified Caballeronia]|uniref:response regulator transcription factor n=1 Tax=unclassified Caballeronia TaxID=2646786 RepID=UPI00202933D5|nr:MULTISPECIES: response regulator [unclassified Caballeronia]MDR5765891.1 response regulator [Caballeronia sp. LZ028]